jgi:tetratricopeptide (TPR) repeat protein
LRNSIGTARTIRTSFPCTKGSGEWIQPSLLSPQRWAPIECSGNLDEAIRFWNQALAISPELLLVHANLAEALLRAERQDQAQAVLRKALEFNAAFSAHERSSQQDREMTETSDFCLLTSVFYFPNCCST